MASEPPIELQGRRNLRVSTDSLQRDIFDAIRTAHTLEVPGSETRRTSNAGDTLHTATSANSLLTGNSYIDFGSTTKSIAPARAKAYRERFRQMQRSVVASSVSTGSRIVRRPFKIMRRPFAWAQAYWRRRHRLPPTANGRKVPINFADPSSVHQADERNKNKPYCSNLITSSIYTVYDFVPRQLVVQFSKMANMYFLFVAILQMIPSWSATGNYTTIVPLCVFVFISMAREGYEDWTRHRNDKEENNREVLVARKTTGGDRIEYESVKWKNVKVGDVVRVLQNEWVPADIVLLHSSGTKGQCSIETLALDGETSLKNREVPADVQAMFSADRIEEAQAMITSEDPNLDLFNFEGRIALGTSGTGGTTGADNGSTTKINEIPLENSNIVYRGSALRNTASVIGVCIFTGKETKMQLNASRNARTKTPKLQGKVNRIVGLLAAYVLLLSGFFSLANQRIQAKKHYWMFFGIEVTRVQSVMGFIIMFNTLIPLSLYVSMEICKVFQQFLMQNDIDMYDSVNDVRCSVQTASLNEELGQVSYVFSDKTGTLTDNIMLFRKMTVAGYPWIHDIDLYFEDDDDDDDGKYLFHKAQPMNIEDLNEDDAILLEQLANLPRRSFGGRISNAARISTSRPSLSHPAQQRLSMGRPSTNRPLRPSNPLPRPSTSSVLRSSTGRPSMGQPSMGQPSMGRPSMGQLSMGRPSMGQLSMGRPSIARPTSPVANSPAVPQTPTNRTSVNWSETPLDLEKPHAHFATPREEFPSPPPLPQQQQHPVQQHAAQQQQQQQQQPRPSGVTAVSTSHWQSTSAPLKPQSTPSTLTLLRYLMTHPNTVFAERAKFFLLALSLCHSASPEVDLTGSMDSGEVEIEQLDYQASSPDELALVAAARDLGYLVIDRQHDSLTIRTYPDGFENAPKDEEYRILDTIEFSSSRKRMSIVIQLPDGRIVVFCKGADNVMIERLRKSLLGPAHQKQTEIYAETQVRRSVEAELANGNRDLSVRPSIDSILQRRTADIAIQESGRRSMQMLQQQHQHQQHNSPSYPQNRASIQSAVADATAVVAENAVKTRASQDMNRSQFGTGNGSGNGSGNGNGSGTTTPANQFQQESLELDDMNDRQVLEKTLEQIDEFSTEGLRTLLYGHRFISAAEYTAWKTDFDEARSAISNRQAKVEAVGERLEQDFSVTGATAIEDKLQKGVPEAIDKLRRANIRLWMLTGDKRETAVNIGYSCRLIKDFSTVIPLKADDNLEAKVMAALEELDSSNIAHCVVVVDGQTLSVIEKDPILMSLFVELGLRADSAIVCRASPAQKANIVKAVRQREPSKVMLAIGDGANDIAMIQAADVGVGIAGREGLQAARSSDFSIGQFRFLLKLLLVHGRWNYVRTCKYILATFYKEFLFYMSQAIYQRNTMFTGTSVFESWSIAMFNTLFTSLPVICVGILDQDLSPETLIAVPELYRIGPENREFKLALFFKWIILAMLECVMVSFLSYKFYGEQYGVKDNSIFPLGVVIYSAIVGIICIRIQFVSMVHYITIISLAIVLISCGGYLLFNILIGLVYITDPDKTYYAAKEFWNELGTEIAYWATVLLLIGIGFLFEYGLEMLTTILHPTDRDVFQVMEKDPRIMSKLQSESELELHQGWEYQDKLDHSWFAVFRGKWPGQKRPNTKVPSVTLKRNKLDILQEKLRLKKPVDYEKEIQEILERRQKETQPMA